ncbi:hypothetical protein EBBID32_15000 [Sphingobium indicum BiD32]|uniref:Uncharacterized protein n=1 Tax=Sphingobium indicum BiD32 TaxID=1301087 RepID=N1MJP2_9SPHN|nr:hypothetical protein EBBID32_15000 [Sphingobium indicum BiD32]
MQRGDNVAWVESAAKMERMTVPLGYACDYRGTGVCLSRLWSESV